jgi:hypothetical protein
LISAAFIAQKPHLSLWGFRFNAKRSFMATASNFAREPQNDESARENQHTSRPRMLLFRDRGAGNSNCTMTEEKKEQTVAKIPQVSPSKRNCAPYRL